MKKYIFLIHFVILSCLLWGISFGQKSPKDQFQFPPLNEIKMPRVEKFEFKNGMKLYLIEDHQYPTIDLRALIGVGSIYEPADKIGLATITGRVIRTGGTETRTGDEIDKLLETLGATVETSIGDESGSVYVSLLKEDIDKGIEILADILMHPVFRQEKIDLAKIEARSLISRRNDNIWQITNREFNSLIYGKTHPYARYTEYATIDAITRDDIVAFYKKYYHPNNIIFAAWGDFKTKDLKKKIEAAFAKWSATKIDFPLKPKVDYEYKYTINFVQKSDVNQTHIQMGHIGGLMNDPDYPALTIMNQILSYDRMFKVIRTQEGLTYAPWGHFGADYAHPGVFNCGTQTKSQSTVYAIRLMLKEVKRMTEEEVTDEELARAKDTYLNGFVFNFDSISEIINRMMTYAYHNYPLDFIESIRDGVEKVTKADVLRVAKKHLHPDNMQILVVGKQEDFDESLSVLGEVNEVDITIPVPKEEAPEATQETLLKGKKLFNDMINACGGIAAFKSIKSYRSSANITVVTPQGEMAMDAKAITAFPDRIRFDVKMPMGEVTQILNGDQAWMISAQGTMPAPAQMKDEFKAMLWREFPFLFSKLEDENLAVQYLGEEDVNGQNYDVLLFSPKETKNFKIYIDPNTSIPAAMSYQGMNMMGAPVNTEELFSDYRDVSGIKSPFKIIKNQDGKKVQETIISDFVINVPVDDNQFVVEQ